MEDAQRRLYDGKLKEGLCWKTCGVKCPLGPEFLKELYSWSHNNPLHPYLAWKICDPCEGKIPLAPYKEGAKVRPVHFWIQHHAYLDQIGTVTKIEIRGNSMMESIKACGIPSWQDYWATVVWPDGKESVDRIDSFEEVKDPLQ